MINIMKDQANFFEYINHSIVENKKLSHAYLIETKGYPEYKQVVLEFIKIILSLNLQSEEISKMKSQIDSNNYPDLNFIYPDGNFIKKDQLLALEEKYFKKSMLDNKLIYVIDPAEKLNSASANTILKFLEEPPENIIAILIAENKYNVLETIVSRCQCLSLINYEDYNYKNEILEFIQEMNTPKKILIKYDYYLENLFLDKNMCIENLKEIEEYLFQLLKSNQKNQNYYIKQIELIEKEKEKLQYNINIKLWFSNYIFQIIEVMRNV